MPDKLLFKGAKHVLNQEGNEMLMLRPRAGDTHQVARWYDRAPGNVVYISCQIFRVTTQSHGELALVIPLAGKETVKVWIEHNDGEFTFLNDHIGVDRIAVFNSDLSELYEEYQFSKISGGAVLKRTITPLPTNAQLGDITLTGNQNVEGGTNHVYVADNTGTADDVVYVLTSDNAGDAVTGLGVAFEDRTGFSELTVTGTSAAAGTSGTASLTVTVTESVERMLAKAAQTFKVTTKNGKYLLDGEETPDITANAGDTLVFDVSDASNRLHPLEIYTDADKTTKVTVGRTDAKDYVIFTPPITGTFSYQCVRHSNMGGTITIS